MYHPHSDEMVQMAMGMMGFFVVHPRDPAERRVDRDFVFLLNAFDIEAGSYVPRVNEMTDFNLWCFNTACSPASIRSCARATRSACGSATSR